MVHVANIARRAYLELTLFENVVIATDLYWYTVIPHTTSGFLKKMFQNSESPNYLNSSPCWWCHHACWHVRAIPPLRVSSNLPEKDCHQSPRCKGCTLQITGKCMWKYKWLILSTNEKRPCMIVCVQDCTLNTCHILQAKNILKVIQVYQLDRIRICNTNIYIYIYKVMQWCIIHGGFLSQGQGIGDKPGLTS